MGLGDLPCGGGHSVGGVTGSDEYVESSKHPSLLVPAPAFLSEYPPFVLPLSIRAPGRPADARLLLAFTHLLLQSFDYSPTS